MNEPSNPSWRGRITRSLLVLNGALWLFFAVEFAIHSTPYVPHQPIFEEVPPLYIFFGHGLPIEQWMSPYMKVIRFVEWPSFRLGDLFFAYPNAYNISKDHFFAGISLTGFVLLLICAASFLQWYVIGLAIDAAVQRLSSSRAAL